MTEDFRQLDSLLDPEGVYRVESLSDLPIDHGEGDLFGKLIYVLDEIERAYSVTFGVEIPESILEWAILERARVRSYGE